MFGRTNTRPVKNGLNGTMDQYQYRSMDGTVDVKQHRNETRAQDGHLSHFHSAAVATMDLHLLMQARQWPGPSLISRTVSVDVKHHVYLMARSVAARQRREAPGDCGTAFVNLNEQPLPEDSRIN